MNCATFSTDFELLITGSEDKTVRVFNAASGRFVVSLSGHKGTCTLFGGSSVIAPLSLLNGHSRSLTLEMDFGSRYLIRLGNT